MSLSEELNKQIEQEADAIYNRFEARAENEWDRKYAEGYAEGHHAAAEKYAEKWQAAEQRAERYEKALREIQTKAVFPKTENEAGIAIYNILKLCNEVLTPKPTTDERLQ